MQYSLVLAADESTVSSSGTSLGPGVWLLTAVFDGAFDNPDTEPQSVSVSAGATQIAGIALPAESTLNRLTGIMFASLTVVASEAMQVSISTSNPAVVGNGILYICAERIGP